MYPNFELVLSPKPTLCHSAGSLIVPRSCCSLHPQKVPHIPALPTFKLRYCSGSECSAAASWFTSCGTHLDVGEVCFTREEGGANESACCRQSFVVRSTQRRQAAEVSYDDDEREPGRREDVDNVSWDQERKKTGSLLGKVRQDDAKDQTKSSDTKTSWTNVVTLPAGMVTRRLKSIKR